MISENPTVVPIRTVSTGPATGDGAATAAAFAEPVEPVTRAEVDALARRIRVEAKLTRITVVGTILGLVCGTAAVRPFITTDGYMTQSLSASGDIAAWGFLPAWLLAGLLPLLAFYAGRLQFQSGSSTDALETSLRKIRRIILGCMFASVAAFVTVVSHRESHTNVIDAASWTALTYAGCFAACAFIIGDVRRGLGDFDTELQRRRRKLARGFAVELLPAEPPALPDGIPLATLATPHPMPHAAPAAAPWPSAIDTLREDEHSKDLRLLMTLAICVALAVHAVRLGSDLAGVLRQAEQIQFFLQTSLVPGNANVSSVAMLLVLLATFATLLLAACAVLWIVWGILSLNYGPAFRRAIGWLTVVTLIPAVLCVLPGWVYGPRYSRARLDFGMLSRAPEIVHALFLGLLLTRPGVKSLFARSSQTDDSD